MKTNVAWSTEEDEYLAGKACSKKAVLDLVQTKVAFLFTSIKYNHEEFLKGIKEELGTAPIIGCTSNDGIIVPEGYITSKNGFAGILAIGDMDTTVGVASSLKLLSARETGRKVAIQAMNKVGTHFSPSFYFMIANSGEEEEYIKGIQDIIGDVPIFGGSPSYDNSSKKCKIFTNDNIFEEGVAVAFFYTNKKIQNEYNNKYHETINSGVITRVEGKRKIKEINGLPAAKQYAEWTGLKIKELKEDKILKASILKPLAVKSEIGEVALIKNAVKVNKDYSIDVENNVQVNTALIQMQIDEEEIVKSPKVVLRDLKLKLNNEPAGYLIMHSEYRRMAVLDKIEEMSKLLEEEAKGVPYIMPFTFNEYGRAQHGANSTSGLTISATAFCK